MQEWTLEQLRAERDHAAADGLLAVLEAQAKAADLDPLFVIAVASRETGIRNILGDYGHGHGPMQLDDRSHPIPAGWEDDAALVVRPCCVILADNLKAATQRLSDPRAQMKWAAAAYNCGPANADRGMRRGDVDRFTAHADYGRDVLLRMKAFEALGSA